MEHLEKEKEDGATTTPYEPDNDALVKALGKKDYGGYVKGLGRSGVGVGLRQAFGKVPRKSSKSRDEEMESMRATISRLESRLEEVVASMSSSHNLVKNKADSDDVLTSRVVAPHEKAPPEVIIVFEYESINFLKTI